jgi:uncharacterized protein DUF3365
MLSKFNKTGKMKFIKIFAIVISLFLVFGCSSNSSKLTDSTSEKNSKSDVKVAYIYQNDEQFNALKDKGARIAKISQVALGKALQNAIAKGGYENAVGFCKNEAMRITDSISNSEDVDIKRVAKKNRNPANATDEVESKIFKQYIMEFLSGTTLKPRIAINENGNPVYYKPIITNKMCLTCHGTPGETMSLEITDIIRENYPDDKATNFSAGHPRGMWAITFKGINVNTNK